MVQWEAIFSLSAYWEGVILLSRFPSVPMLRGELKRSEIRGGLRYQLTTQEFVLQRNSKTYRIALDSILGLVPCHSEDIPWTDSAGGTGALYKIVATVMHIVLPSQVVEQEGASLYTRLSPGFARVLTQALHWRGAAL